MKHAKIFALGILRILLGLLVIVAAPIWIPIMIIYSIGRKSPGGL